MPKEDPKEDTGKSIRTGDKLDAQKILSDLKPNTQEVVEINVAKKVKVYEKTHEGEAGELCLHRKVAYDVGIGSLPEGSQDLYIIDQHQRLGHGLQAISLRPVSLKDPLCQQKYVTQYHKFLGRISPDKISDTVNHAQVHDIYQYVPTINPNDFFGKVGNWKACLDYLFKQGFEKDEALVAAFKSAMIPLPFKPTQWQSYNPHGFIFTQSKTGKSSFAEDVMGYHPMTEPSAPGLAGGLQGHKITTGSMAGTGLLFIDEINTVDSKVLDLILNALEKGIASRGKVGGADGNLLCRTTKTLYFAGNPIFKDPELMPYSFNQVISSLTNSVTETSRIGNRLGIFLFGTEYAKTKKVYRADRDLLMYIRNAIYDTIALEHDKWEKLLEKLEFTWLNEPDEEWMDFVARMSMGVREPNLQSFISGTADSVDNMRMAALRWTVLENMDRFAQESNQKLLNDIFMDELAKNYEFIKSDINGPSLKRLKGQKIIRTKDNFIAMALNSPAFLTLSDTSIAQMFGGVSPNTIKNWRKCIDDEFEIMDSLEQEEIKTEMIPIDNKAEIEEAIKEELKTPPKKPYWGSLR
jgi:hypothetical protein